MSGTHWIVEGRIDPRWPINTRGNIGEVFPEVLTPLTYELGVKPAEAGWREAYSMMGIADRRDFDSTEPPVIIGLYGGYGYLNLSYLRMLGVRAPGSSPGAIDVAFFGEGNPPPYDPQPGDKRRVATVRILRIVLKALAQKSMPEPVADSERAVAEWQARQPDLATASDDVLLRYLRDYPPVFKQVFRNHMITTGTAAIVSGVLSDGATAAGQPGLVTELLGAADGVVSAQYSQDLWKVAQIVQRTPDVATAFDAGVEGLGGRVSGLASADEFRKAFAGFIATHGHRGPNDWELSSRTWENTPELAYAAIECMRHSTYDLSPVPRVAGDETRRAEAAAQVIPHLKLIDKANFRKAVIAAPWWARAREATRDLAIRAHNPTRRAFFELARRAAERGGVDDLRDVAMLDPLTELPEYLAAPREWHDRIAERVALRDRFATVEPPFFITSQAAVPGIEQLERNVPTVGELAAPGAVLIGAPGSAGVARGRARVVLDPGDPAGLEPGDVLVAPLTDPSWTPLFLPAAAVVVNVGALMSHAVIVSRELGIPCVVSVESATTRIPDGAMVEVNGVAGTVTVL
jgi:phosphohistidine swiveling domain-containing protein